MTKEEIGEKLKAKRISCGMTQQEVAEKPGRKQPIVGHWETGYSQPDANTLFMLCDIYGTTVDDVFGFTPKENFSKSEYEHNKKYRFISTHSPDGASVVDMVLDREHAIAETLKLKEQNEHITELTTVPQTTVHNTPLRLINTILLPTFNYHYTTVPLVCNDFPETSFIIYNCEIIIHLTYKIIEVYNFTQKEMLWTNMEESP